MPAPAAAAAAATAAANGTPAAASGRPSRAAAGAESDASSASSASKSQQQPGGGVAPSSSRPVHSREVGAQATWSLSSCKAGFGVEQLRDDTLETYWQSDGQLPHLVNIQFRRKTTLSDVRLYTDFKLDESYTPSKVSVRCGTNFNDLQEIEVVELGEPSGWVIIPLKDLNDQPVRTFMVQIAVIANHQSGRDTHLRQIKVFSPVEEKRVTTAGDLANNWSTPECRQFMHMR